MKGQKLGYIRVSTLDQNTERQLEGINLDRKFTDKASGKDTNRNQLEELLLFARTGDIIIIHSMDRLARNLNDLLRVVQLLTDKGVCVQFVKENLSFDGEDSPMSKLMLSIMGAFAEFERSLIRERQREGIALAKKRGVYKGRKKALSDDDISLLASRANDGENKSQLAKEFGISRETVYQYLRQSK
ncbi:recombinase family protein [Marinicella rhabdoformis]|uniref:recombinase family protein n=1 Tax=Marinicella rhabdoformis TaxID=2580566 RepID=UPI0012AED90E|nr:recombinase family protein [Marinicella rhabdoformis]